MNPLRKHTRLFVHCLLCLLGGLPAACTIANGEWPAAVKEISYLSSADKTQQPALFYAPPQRKPQPLLVALHSWSGDYQQDTSVPYARWCLTHNWVFIHPNFRGPNQRPEATGSELVIQDVLSALEYAKQNAAVDESRIYLMGVSGGGHLALLLAGRASEIWAGVSAWVPITDLTAWYHESKAAGRRYAEDIVKSCGGVPEPGSAAEKECVRRSPLTYLVSANQVPVDINAGIHDGHTGSVPISHSLHAFNLLATAAEQLSEEQIRYFINARKVPPSLPAAQRDLAYGHKPVLFRRQSNRVRLTIFDGGHEAIYDAGLNWLAQQRKK
jgi:dienelactone hydrolase